MLTDSPAMINACSTVRAVVGEALQAAANALAANTGQVCFAATRVYVQEGIFDKFSKMYKEKLEEKAKTIGDPDKESTQMGPLVDEAQFLQHGERQYERVRVLDPHAAIQAVQRQRHGVPAGGVPVVESRRPQNSRSFSGFRRARAPRGRTPARTAATP